MSQSFSSRHNAFGEERNKRRMQAVCHFLGRGGGDISAIGVCTVK
jgi:hypothetical protein